MGVKSRSLPVSQLYQLHCQGQLGTFGLSLDNNGNEQHALKRGGKISKTHHRVYHDCVFLDTLLLNWAKYMFPFFKYTIPAPIKDALKL